MIPAPVVVNISLVITSGVQGEELYPVRKEFLAHFSGDSSQNLFPDCRLVYSRMSSDKEQQNEVRVQISSQSRGCHNGRSRAMRQAADGCQDFGQRVSSPVSARNSRPYKQPLPATLGDNTSGGCTFTVLTAWGNYGKGSVVCHRINLPAGRIGETPWDSRGR